MPSNSAIWSYTIRSHTEIEPGRMAAKCGLRSKDRVGARVCGSSQELTECVAKKTPTGGLALKAGSSVRC